VTEAGTGVRCVPRVVREAIVKARPGFTIDKQRCLVISAFGKNLSFLRALHDAFDLQSPCPPDNAHTMPTLHSPSHLLQARAVRSRFVLTIAFES